MIVALVAPAPAAQQTPPPEDDIVIIARKMRTVRLEYSASGPWLRQCRPVVSSGDARIDRLTCAILAACIRSGRGDRLRPRECVNRRIASLEGQSLAAAETSVAASAPPTTSPIPAVHKVPADDIVITARRGALSSAMWTLREEGNYRSSRRTAIFPPRNWRVCIAPDAPAKALALMLADRRDGRPAWCQRWDIKVDGDRVEGKMRCTQRVLQSSLRTTGTLEGSFTDSEVRLRKEQRSTSLGGDFQSVGQYAITGRRTGDC